MKVGKLAVAGAGLLAAAAIGWFATRPGPVEAPPAGTGETAVIDQPSGKIVDEDRDTSGSGADRDGVAAPGRPATPDTTASDVATPETVADPGGRTATTPDAPGKPAGSDRPAAAGPGSETPAKPEVPEADVATGEVPAGDGTVADRPREGRAAPAGAPATADGNAPDERPLDHGRADDAGTGAGAPDADKRDSEAIDGGATVAGAESDAAAGDAAPRVRDGSPVATDAPEMSGSGAGAAPADGTGASAPAATATPTDQDSSDRSPPAARRPGVAAGKDADLAPGGAADEKTGGPDRPLEVLTTDSQEPDERTPAEVAADPSAAGATTAGPGPRGGPAADGSARPSSGEGAAPGDDRKLTADEDREHPAATKNAADAPVADDEAEAPRADDEADTAASGKERPENTGPATPPAEARDARSGADGAGSGQATPAPSPAKDARDAAAAARDRAPTDRVRRPASGDTADAAPETGDMDTTERSAAPDGAAVPADGTGPAAARADGTSGEGATEDGTAVETVPKDTTLRGTPETDDAHSDNSADGGSADGPPDGDRAARTDGDGNAAPGGSTDRGAATRAGEDLPVPGDTTADGAATDAGSDAPTGNDASDRARADAGGNDGDTRPETSTGPTAVTGAADAVRTTETGAANGAPRTADLGDAPAAPVSDADGVEDPREGAGDATGKAPPTDERVAALPVPDVAERDSGRPPVDTTTDAPVDGAAIPGAGDPDDAPVSGDAPAPMDPDAPAFDLVRIDPDGQTVLAGRARPNQRVEIVLDGEVIETVTTDAAGNFVAILQTGASDSARELVLRVPAPDAAAADQDVATAPDVGTAAPDLAPPAAGNGRTVATGDSDGGVDHSGGGGGLAPPARTGDAGIVPPRRPDAGNDRAEAPPPDRREPDTTGARTLAPEAPVAPVTGATGARTGRLDRPVDGKREGPGGAVAAAGADAPPRVPGVVSGSRALTSAPVIILPPAQPEDAPTILSSTPEDLKILQPSVSDINSVVLDRISYGETGDVRLAGRARPGRAVRVYGNRLLVGTTQVLRDGTWSLSIDRSTGEAIKLLRMDELTPTGDVATRIEAPFTYVRSEPKVVRARRVVVQRGDVLWRIAEQHYGEGLRYSVIYGANADLIRDPDLIYPGQIFSVPELVDAAPRP